MGPEVPEPSDAELLRRHVTGDTAAFGLLFQRHKDRLWAVALRTTCDPDDAADALQEAMISAFRRAKDFRGDSAVTTWLHRIVVNASLDRLRRRPARSVSWSGDPDALESMLTQDPRGGPSLAVPSPRAGAGLLPGAPPADPATPSRPGWTSPRRSGCCRNSSAPPWCSSTCWAIQSPRWP